MPIPATLYKDYPLKFPRTLALYIKRFQRHKRALMFEPVMMA